MKFLFKMKDLTFFMVVITIFICSFGIAIQATLHPNNEFSLSLIKNIIEKSYWPIYGEIKLLDEINEPNETCFNEKRCHDPIGATFSYLALMIYMILANVLLLEFYYSIYVYQRCS
jgi:transient receptor potential cation channel subfamily M protein 1